MNKTRSSLLIRVRDTADNAGWCEFCVLYKPLLHAYVLTKGVAKCDADDAVQDVLIQLLKTLPEFHLNRERGRFRTWLWKVTMNTLVGRARRDRSRAKAEEVWVKDTEYDADQGAEEDDWKTQYRRGLLEYAQAKVRERAEPQTWACFEEHFMRGRCSAEVAAELGVTPNVVDVNKHRIMNRIREVFLRDLEGLFDADDLLPR